MLADIDGSCTMNVMSRDPGNSPGSVWVRVRKMDRQR